MKVFFKFFKYIKKHLKPLIVANVSMVFYVIFNLLSLGILMPFTDILFNQISPNMKDPGSLSLGNAKEFLNFQLSKLLLEYEKIDLIKFFCFAIVFVFIMRNLFSYLQTFFMASVEQGIIRDIRLQLYTHLHKMSLGYFTEEKKGVLISRIINDINIIRDSIVWVINSIFRDPPAILSFTFTLFIINWKLTLIILLSFPIAALLLSKIGNSLKRKSIKSQESIGDITSILEETFGAIRIVKAFNMEEYEIKRFQQEEKKYFSIISSLIRRRALASPITETIAIIAISIVIYFIGKDIIANKSDMTAGALAAYLLIFFQMMPSLKLFGQLFNNIKEGSAAAERVFAIIDTKPAIVDSLNSININSFEKNIVFKDVSFKYEKSDTILDKINLTISKGEIVAIVGHSGAGKTTMIDLIPRFYDVTGGQILFDDKDVKDISQKSLRNLLGIVTQETILFNDSVRNNIAYGLAEISESKIIDSAKAANAHNFIMDLEKGYDTIIGDRGVKLSGGEKQRLSIARALLKNPPILILDEATSALDTQSEILVQEAIERLMKGRTSIVIAHRLSTIKNAHKIIVLDGGKIAESGTHDNLIKLNGLYNRIYHLQFKV